VSLRRLAPLALVIALLPALPSCYQVSDEEGDGTLKPVGLSSPALDVISADFSSGKNEVTAILRLKSTAVESDNLLRGGAIWNFNVSAGGIDYSFTARWPSTISSAGNPALKGGLTAGSNESAPKATFRRDGNNFIWTVARAAMPALKKAKTYVVINNATSGADSLSGDSAFAKPNTKYLDKSPSCLASK
jgi:hypothetical protein